MIHKIHKLWKFGKHVSISNKNVGIKWDNDMSEGKIVIGDISNLDGFLDMGIDKDSTIIGIGGTIRW